MTDRDAVAAKIFGVPPPLTTRAEQRSAVRALTSAPPASFTVTYDEDWERRTIGSDTLEEAINFALWVDTWGAEMPGIVIEIRQGETLLFGKVPRCGFLNEALRQFAIENGVDVTPYRHSD